MKPVRCFNVGVFGHHKVADSKVEISAMYLVVETHKISLPIYLVVGAVVHAKDKIYKPKQQLLSVNLYLEQH